MARPGFLETLSRRPIVGDGSYVQTLEKRGYVRAGCWTPECVIEHPEAVEQLHREFVWAGADVVQAFSFYASDGIVTTRSSTKDVHTCNDLTQAAFALAHKVGDPVEAFICGGLSPTASYEKGRGDREVVKKEFREQVEIFKKNGADFLLGEFFGFVDEAVLAVEVMKAVGLPVALTMRIGPSGDFSGFTPEECAVKIAKAGADVVGLNCAFDPTTCLTVIKRMKSALDAAHVSPYLMVQPVAYHCPDVARIKEGHCVLPEYPFALEPRLLTRWDARKFARDAYNAGVRYIGGCCGFEPYHIREMAEELAEEIGHRPRGQDKNGIWGSFMVESQTQWSREKASSREHWEQLTPTTGRPHSASLRLFPGN